MAEFSKQYCETHDMGFDGDFDIYEEWIALVPGFIRPGICEGYGFDAIGKLEECPDKVMVHFWNFDTEEGEWVDFETIKNIPRR